MKKLVSIILALAMILVMGTTAIAAEEKTVNYTAYQLLTLSSSLKTTDHPKNCDGNNHTDACYNYRYGFNTKYETILKQEILDTAGDDFWPNSVKPSIEKVTIDDVCAFLNSHTGDTGIAYGSIRQVADRLYKSILAAGLTPDLEAETVEEIEDKINADDKGYWMVADVRALTNNENDANALVVLDTKGEQDIHINMNSKISYPTVEKRVKDIEDSEDTDITTNSWWVAADHDIGDNVPFKIASTLPNNMRAYDTYTLIFHDTMDPAFELDESTIRVLKYDTHNAAHVDVNMQNGKPVAENLYNINTNPENCSFEVVIPNVRAIPGITNDATIVVYYEAKLTSNQVVFGKEGNANKVYVEYSNNPYGNGTGKTNEVEVKVFTYKLEINKIDAFQQPLAGAAFTLYKLDLNAVKPDSTDPMLKQGYVPVTAQTGTATKFVWEGLDDGDYILKETVVPEGYNGMKDIAFSISADHSTTTGDPLLIELSSGDLNGTVDVENGVISKAVENKSGIVLPETGAEGTFFLITGGTVLVVLAAVFMITRKKMSVYED